MTHYVTLVNGSAIATDACPNNAVSTAMKAAQIHGESAVTVESHGIYGQYAAPELIGTPAIHPFNWLKAKYELMSM